MEDERRKEKIKACIAIAVIILAILITGIITMKYHVEGETNMPFTLSKIIIVNQVDTVNKSGENTTSCIIQNNNIYFAIEKNENNKENEIIESVSIENIQVIENPKVGTIKAYMPNSSEGRLFSYSDEYIVQENKLTYKGASKSNSKTLEIGNQGGNIAISIVNTNIGEYTLKTNEINENLLSKVNVELEEITFKVALDVVIKLRNTSYTTNVILDLPSREGLIEEGISSQEITDRFVFKRVIN